MNTRSWLITGGVIAGVLGATRLVMGTSASVLGSTVNCGDAFAYLSGTDNKYPTAMAICGPALRNATIEGVILLFAALLLLLSGWTHATSSPTPSTPPPVAPPPGWYQTPGHPDRERLWDGKRWTISTRPVQRIPPTARGHR